MDKIISPIDMQQAWQTAFQLRTCPSDTVLRSIVTDKNLERHLASCSICREKRNMPAEQVDAWQKLFDKFAPQIHQTVSAPQPGQVWVLSKKCSRWGDDGYYYSPPNVLLLEKLDNSKDFRAAQLYSDIRLMGEGDVLLGDRFGFAQAWNCYTISQDMLECWLGSVSDSLVKAITQSVVLKFPPENEHSVLSFFRKLEIKVGSYASLTSEPGQTESVEENVIDLMPGLKLAISGARDFVLDITIGTLDLLRGTFKPAMVLRSGPSKPAVAKLTDEQKKLIEEHCPVVPVDLKVVGDTLTVTLKWLRNKPVNLPSVKTILDNVEVPAANINIINAENVIITHDSLSLKTKSQIYALRVEYADETLKLDVSSEK